MEVLDVSEKGGVSVYYINRLPVTLYADEWNAVFRVRCMILRFIATHHAQLSCRCDERIRQGLHALLESGQLGNETRVDVGGDVLWCKVSVKRAVSLYGVRRRFPVTLYCDQWLRILLAQEQIESFIAANREILDTKGCCVPRQRKSADTRPLHESVCADNIIRPRLVKHATIH